MRNAFRAVLLTTGLALTAACTTAGGGTHPAAPLPPVIVGIAAINDFHGNLEAPKQSALLPDGKGGTAQVPAGGAAWLASVIDRVRGQYPNHLTLSAGDLISSSPVISSIYLDEPAVEVMNRIGLDFNAVGNHEFDAGVAELQRKQTGGCAQFTTRKPCQVEPFRGAQFRFLAANSVVKADGSTLFPATALRSFGTGARRVTVGVIGLTLKGTDTLVPPAVAGAITFADEADTANALARQLRAQGADAVVMLIHQGGRTTGAPDPNGCEGLNSEIRPVLDRLDTTVDLVISGHTHWAYVCDYGRYNPAKPFLLTSAGLWGEFVTDITLEIDPAAHKVIAKHARNVVVASVAYIGGRGEVPVNPALPPAEPRADIAAYVAKYVDAAKDYATRKVGFLGAPAEKTEGAAAATGGPLGNLIADAQLAATAGAGAQIACTNPFGIRRSLVPQADGSVTFGDLYAVQPFNTVLVTVTMTGAEFRQTLEEGLDTNGPEQVLACSAGLKLSYDRTRPVGQRIAELTFGGAPLDPVKDYRITVNAFLVGGGDTFATFLKGRNLNVGMTDLAALEGWLKASPPRVPPTEKRAIDLRPETNPARPGAPPGVKY